MGVSLLGPPAHCHQVWSEWHPVGPPALAVAAAADEGMSSFLVPRVPHASSIHTEIINRVTYSGVQWCEPLAPDPVPVLASVPAQTLGLVIGATAFPRAVCCHVGLSHGMGRWAPGALQVGSPRREDKSPLQ